MGRATQGVKLINLKGGDAIAAVAKVMQNEEIVEISDEAETPDSNDEISDGTTIVNDTEE
jgi:DNA gyrase subunit A